MSSTEEERPAHLSMVEGTGGKITTRPSRPWLGAVGWFNEGMVEGREDSQWQVPGRRFRSDAPPNAQRLPAVERLTVSRSESGPGTGPIVRLVHNDNESQAWRLSRPLHVYRSTNNGEIQTKLIQAVTVEIAGTEGLCHCVLDTASTVARWTGQMQGSDVVVEAAEAEWGELVVSLFAAAGHESEARLVVKPNRPGQRNMVDPWTGEELSVTVGQGLEESSFYGSPRVPELWKSGLDVMETMTDQAVKLMQQGVLVRLAGLGATPVPNANTAVSTQWLISSRDSGQPTASEEVRILEETQADHWPQEVEGTGEERAPSTWVWEPSIKRRVDGRGDRPSSVPTRLYDIQLRQVVPGGSNTPGARYIALSYVWTQWETLEGLLEAGESVARHLNVRYLWCDRLCIDQDDAADIARQLPHMLRYYQHAEATLVLLPDVTASKQNPLLYPTTVLDVRHIAAEYGALVRGILDARWMRRVWTCQEALASHALIFRTAHQYLDGNHLAEMMRMKPPRDDGKGLVCGSYLSQALWGVDCIAGTVGSGHLWVRTGLHHALRSRWLDRGEVYWRLPFASLPKYLKGRQSSREQDEIYGMLGVTQLDNVPVRYDWGVAELMDHIVDNDLAGYSVMFLMPHSDEEGEGWRPQRGLKPSELSSWDTSEALAGVEFAVCGRMVKMVGWLVDCASSAPWASASYSGKLGEVQAEVSLHMDASVVVPPDASILILRPQAAGGTRLTGVVMKPLLGEVGHFLGLCAVTLVAARPSDQLLKVREVVMGRA